MPDLTIRKELWSEFVDVAEKQHQSPEALVEQVLKEYLQRVSNEDLLKRSVSTARRAPFRIDSTENVIRNFRKKA